MARQKSNQVDSRRLRWKGCVIVIWIAYLLHHVSNSVPTANCQQPTKAEHHPQPPITALAFSDKHAWLVAGSQSGLRVMDWPRLENKESKTLEMDSIHDLTFSPDGRHLLIAGGNPGSVGIVQLRSWPALELLQSWSEHQDVVYAVGWRADGREWVSSSWDGYCRVCKIDAVKSHVTMNSHSGSVFAANYLSNGAIASAGADRTIVVWEPSTGVPSKVLRQHTGTVHALAYPSSEVVRDAELLLASASDDRTVRFWQPTIGRMVRFQRFKSTPRSIAWTPDGSRLIVGCDDGTVFQLDPLTLISQELPKQEASVLNLFVARNGDVCISTESDVRKIESPE